MSMNYIQNLIFKSCCGSVSNKFIDGLRGIQSIPKRYKNHNKSPKACTAYGYLKKSNNSLFGLFSITPPFNARGDIVACGSPLFYL